MDVEKEEDVGKERMVSIAFWERKVGCIGYIYITDIYIIYIYYIYIYLP